MHELSGLLIGVIILFTCLVISGWFVTKAEDTVRLAGIGSAIFPQMNKERGAVDAVYQKWN